MLLLKIRNGLELTWDSLDQGERKLVLYVALYLALSLALTLRKSSRERLKRELREELVGG